MAIGECPLPAPTVDGSRKVCGSRLYQLPEEPLVTCRGWRGQRDDRVVAGVVECARKLWGSSVGRAEECVMDDLVEWLRAQLDEDERLARKAARFPYDHPLDAPWEVARLRVEQRAGLSSDPHTARFDPARVLREVEAKRRMLDEHAPREDCATACKVCSGWYASCGCVGGDDFPCTTVRLLAAPYSDRPGYREEWKP